VTPSEKLRRLAGDHATPFDEHRRLADDRAAPSGDLRRRFRRSAQRPPTTRAAAARRCRAGGDSSSDGAARWRSSVGEKLPKGRFFLAKGWDGPYSETDFVGGEEFFRRQSGDA
jgi:hypothetical protein